MINVGSTMTTEAWDEYYKPNLTWNHAWGSAPANIIPRKLAGIEPLEAGFKRFKVQPQPGDLMNFGVKMPTIRGAIELNLERFDEGWNLNLVIPGNSEAELYLPEHLEIVSINSIISEYQDMFKSNMGNLNIFRLSSGRYEIIATQEN